MTDHITPRMFSEPWKEDNDTLIATLGGKGGNLYRMTVEMGLPVPEGFTIPTTWTEKHLAKWSIDPDLKSKLDVPLKRLALATGRKFGDPKNPLLVSVRSGAPKSMPGMMETILNLGLNDKTVVGLAAQTNERFAWDSYRRFVQMYAVTALDMDPEPFNDHTAAAKAFTATGDLDVTILKRLVKKFKAMVKEAGHSIPDDVNEQLHGAILAVFKSWYADKAVTYRNIEGIPHDLGTAVNVQRMVFGNMNDKSGTGVVFTRDPNTGENTPYGDFLINAQGEDVVDGSTATMPLEAMSEHFPAQYKKLVKIMGDLEKHFNDMCDIEFTIENSKLFILQTRAGKRNPNAAVRIALDMFESKLIDKDTAFDRITSVKTSAKQDSGVFNGVLIGSGLPASPGKVFGKAVFTSEDAVTMADAGEDVILIRQETSPNDISGMSVATGILTAKGGLVSHAAVVARGWGKPCVVGMDTMVVSEIRAMVGGVHKIEKGDLVCIDGETGEVFLGS